MGRLCSILMSVWRTFIPSAQEVERGAPVARVLPFIGGMLSTAVVLGSIFGVPAVSDTIMPVFVLPPFLLISQKRLWVVAGFMLLGLGCMARAFTVWAIPGLEPGQRFTGFIVWGLFGYRFWLDGRAVHGRGLGR